MPQVGYNTVYYFYFICSMSYTVHTNNQSVCTSPISDYTSEFVEVAALGRQLDLGMPQ